MQDPGPSLLEASVFIERFRREHVVIKLGGELLDRSAALDRIAPQIAVLTRCGMRPVVVHGGGKQIDERCTKDGIPVVKHHGRRVTTEGVLNAVVDVVGNQLNAQICSHLRALGVQTRGFADGVYRTLLARRRAPMDVDGQQVDFGLVGDITHVDVHALRHGDEQHAVPVFPCLAIDDQGNWLNVNADSVASKVALALGAQKLIMLSRVPGVMEHPNADGSISQLTLTQAEHLAVSTQVTAGMKVKLNEAINALKGGVPQVHIISGVEPSTLLREIFTEEGCGTLISH
ncbi:MAG: acetylglutamate kinase [Deltaproteobacteria bacterium]|nr:acetylglutamate kinase [Deltaproteobacteria bacterium]